MHGTLRPLLCVAAAACVAADAQPAMQKVCRAAFEDGVDVLLAEPAEYVDASYHTPPPEILIVVPDNATDLYGVSELPCAFVADDPQAAVFWRFTDFDDVWTTAAGTTLRIGGVTLYGERSIVGRGLLLGAPGDGLCADIIPEVAYDSVLRYTANTEAVENVTAAVTMTQYLPFDGATVVVDNRGAAAGVEVLVTLSDACGEIDASLVDGTLYEIMPDEVGLFTVPAPEGGSDANDTVTGLATFIYVREAGSDSDAMYCAPSLGEDECTLEPSVCGPRALCADPDVSTRGTFACRCKDGYAANTTTDGVGITCEEDTSMRLPLYILTACAALLLCVVVAIVFWVRKSSSRACFETEKLGQVESLIDDVMRENEVASAEFKQAHESKAQEVVQRGRAMRELDAELEDLSTQVAMTRGAKGSEYADPEAMDSLERQLEELDTRARSAAENTYQAGHMTDL